MRRSGAPRWAIALGLGTFSESSARSLPTKVGAWTIWTAALTLLFLAWGTIRQDFEWSALLVGKWFFIAAIIVLGSSAGGAFLCRRMNIS